MLKAVFSHCLQYGRRVGRAWEQGWFSYVVEAHSYDAILNYWGVIELDVTSELYSIGRFGDEGLHDRNVLLNNVLMLRQVQ